eukprot:TRINITY_DN8804_c2_g1_i2.p1 TRINITY_DN8804_c2_g1~~TRINITY_DN8804_c2_g1_i2.p1  ORF type:complete len:207 (-),score=-16.35 TRINITY_DN8804_c2_g1_i2:244-864(-)
MQSKVVYTITLNYSNQRSNQGCSAISSKNLVTNFYHVTTYSNIIFIRTYKTQFYLQLNQIQIKINYQINKLRYTTPIAKITLKYYLFYEIFHVQLLASQIRTTQIRTFRIPNSKNFGFLFFIPKYLISEIRTPCQIPTFGSCLRVKKFRDPTKKFGSMKSRQKNSDLRDSNQKSQLNSSDFQCFTNPNFFIRHKPCQNSRSQAVRI